MLVIMSFSLALAVILVTDFGAVIDQPNADDGRRLTRDKSRNGIALKERQLPVRDGKALWA